MHSAREAFLFLDAIFMGEADPFYHTWSLVTKLGKSLKRTVWPHLWPGRPFILGGSNSIKDWAGNARCKRGSFVVNIIAVFKYLKDEQVFLGDRTVHWSSILGWGARLRGEMLLTKSDWWLYHLYSSSFLQTPRKTQKHLRAEARGVVGVRAHGTLTHCCFLRLLFPWKHHVVLIHLLVASDFCFLTMISCPGHKATPGVLNHSAA